MTASTVPPPPPRMTCANASNNLRLSGRSRSLHISNMAQMAMLKPYQKIIGMGSPVLPLLLEELQREPRSLVLSAGSDHAREPVSAGGGGESTPDGRSMDQLGQAAGVHRPMSWDTDFPRLSPDNYRIAALQRRITTA